MNDRKTVLVTGSNGFLGRHLVPYLASHGYKVIAGSTKVSTFTNTNIIPAVLPDLSTPFDWEPLLKQCQAIVHLAGIAHTFASDDLYDSVNRQTTQALARAAYHSGTHLVFVSSIAAQSGSFSDRELTEGDTPQPTTAYGRSKLAAEQAVQSTGASFTILRPVVIYGEGEKGNFAMVHKVSRLPLPLPFGGLKAQRSVLSVENFCSAVAVVLREPSARGETFIVADPRPLSLPEIIVRYRKALGKPPPWLLRIPERWLELFLKAAGRNAMWERIGCPLVAQPVKLLALGWNPS